MEYNLGSLNASNVIPQIRSFHFHIKFHHWASYWYLEVKTTETLCSHAFRQIMSRCLLRFQWYVNMHFFFSESEKGYAQTNRWKQWRRQNAEKVTHIKERLLDQAVMLFNCIPFQSGSFSLRIEFAPRGSEFFPLEQFLMVWKFTFTTLLGDLP